MEWEAAALVLSAAPYGEGAALVHVLSEDHGLHRGLVRGGFSRANAALWQAGNLVRVRWRARLSEQLGQFSGEMIHASGARLLDHPLAMSMLSSCCALADGALPEREAFPDLFLDLVRLVSKLSLDSAWVEAGGMAALLQWEVALLGCSGYGLDLGRCVVTGTTEGLAFVSPRTGCAVTTEAAGDWKDKLLVLPACMVTPDEPGVAADWLAGLSLTGFFLAREAFGQRHLPLPAARERLFERVRGLQNRNAQSED